jgi:cell division septation protein DedD
MRIQRPDTVFVLLTLRSPIKYLGWIILALLPSLAVGAAPVTAPRFAKPIIVEAQSYPWSALGRVNTGGRGFCTGVLISERHVLSQARCLFNAVEGRWWDATDLHFVAGYERERYRFHAAVSDYRVAPGFAGGKPATLANLVNNWALITLAAPIGYEAGWLAIHWFDGPTLRRYQRGEVRMLDVGYRRRRPHVVTVAPGCRIAADGGKCAVQPADPGVLSLLYIDGEIRVAGSPSMRRDAALKAVSLSTADRMAPGTGPAAGSHGAHRVVRRLFAVSEPPDDWDDGGVVDGSVVDGDVVAASAPRAPATARAFAVSYAIEPPAGDAAPLVVPLAVPAAVPAGFETAAAAEAAPGPYVIQLASFTSSEAALRGQAKLQRRHTALLGDLRLAVVTGRHDRLGTVYRLRTGPFATLADARGLCASFRGQNQDCLVTKTR